MAYERKEISIESIRRQEDICREIYDSFVSQKNRPLAMVDTYGCQQNEATSPRWATASRRTSSRPTS